MADDLIAFLRERLDEDEQTAQAVRPGQGSGDATTGQWQDYPHSPNEFSDDPSRPVTMVGCTEPDGREWIVAEVGQWDRSPAVGAHIARHDPARVLAEVAAKRRIIAEAFKHASATDAEFGCCHSPEEIEAGQCPDQPVDVQPILQMLALPYASHSDYRLEWAPAAEG